MDKLKPLLIVVVVVVVVFVLIHLYSLSNKLLFATHDVETC